MDVVAQPDETSCLILDNGQRKALEAFKKLINKRTVFILVGVWA